MTLQSVAREGAQRPRLSQWPARAAGSAGDDAIEFAESIGWDDDEGRGFYVLDDWQKFCVRGLLSEDATAQLCALVTLILVARQNGKNVIIEVVELYAFYVLDLPLILHTAHLQETTADHMARLWAAISSDEELSAISRQVVANGKERIWRSDTLAQIKFKTRSKKVGRGGSPRMVVFDEALYLTDDQIQAMLPSLSAQSMRGDAPILIYTSSAPVEESVVLHRVRKAIVAGEMPDAFFAEWSNEFVINEGESADSAMRRMIADRDLWYVANPGMGVRIDPEWVQANEVPMMSLEAFLIERLGVVFDHEEMASAIPTWADLVDVDSKIASHRSLALDVSPDLKWSCFGAAGRRGDGRLHVEVTGKTEKLDHRPGTGWVVARGVELSKRWDLPIRIEKGSPAAAFITLLREAGAAVEEVSPSDHAAAAGVVISACADKGLFHLGQQALADAVKGAVPGNSGDGGIKWARRSSKVDISPFVAVTIALGGVPAELVEFFAY